MVATEGRWRHPVTYGHMPVILPAIREIYCKCGVSFPTRIDLERHIRGARRA